MYQQVLAAALYMDCGTLRCAAKLRTCQDRAGAMPAGWATTLPVLMV